MVKLTRQEINFLIICSVLLVFLTSISYLVGFSTARSSGDQYLGTNLRYHVDVSVYQSYIEQAKDGHLFFENLYTAETQPRLFFNPLWLVIGWLARIFNLSSLWAFHLVRVLLIPIFVFVSYFFIGRFLKEIVKRKIAACIFFFAGGLGFFFLSTTFSFSKPIDLWLPESNSFLSLYHSPHWLLPIILILVIYQLLLLDLEKRNKFLFGGAIALTILLGIIHPYDLAVIFAVYGYFLLYHGLKNKNIGRYLIKFLVFLVFSAIPLYYFLALKYLDPVFGAWFNQNITPTGSIGSIFVGYGLLFFLLFFGFRNYYQTKNKDNNHFFIIIWFLLNFI
ncbi:hypothetical protein KKI23_00300, partial [Patescibacteria group bacterium]|nr:hypothetical protein [Patescibacteria group bacterium]